MFSHRSSNPERICSAGRFSTVNEKETEMIDRSQIKEHMEVVGKDGQHVGTVDEIEGDRIKLTKSDASDDRHHYINMDLADRVEEKRLYLNIDAAEAGQKAQGS